MGNSQVSPDGANWWWPNVDKHPALKTKFQALWNCDWIEWECLPVTRAHDLISPYEDLYFILSKVVLEIPVSEKPISAAYTWIFETAGHHLLSVTSAWAVVPCAYKDKAYWTSGWTFQNRDTQKSWVFP